MRAALRPMHVLSNKQLLILELLASHGVMYGLQMNAIEPRRLKMGTIYPTLYAMKKRGYVRSWEEDQPHHPGLPRRFYEITPEGQRALRAAHSAAAILNEPLPDGVT